MTSTSASALSRKALRAFGGAGSVILERAGPVQMITLSNTSKRNSMTPTMMAQFADAVDSALESEAAAVFIRGAGGTFCSGASFDMFRDSHDQEALHACGMCMMDVMQETTARLRRSTTVSVCLVEGYALGGGAELATCADFRVFHEDAKIQFVHRRMGLSPGWGGGARLVGIVGRARALELIGSYQPLTAREAARIHLADIVVGVGDPPSVYGPSLLVDSVAAHLREQHRNAGPSEADLLREAALGFIGGFPKEHARTLANVKALVSASTEMPAEADTCATFGVTESERASFRELWGGPENMEAVKNFVEGRKRARR